MWRRWVPNLRKGGALALQVFGKVAEVMWERQWMPRSRSTPSRNARSVLRGGILSLKVLGETDKVTRELAASSIQFALGTDGTVFCWGRARNICRPDCRSIALGCQEHDEHCV